MKKGLLFIFLWCFALMSHAQISVNSSAISTFNTAAQGDLYLDENGVYYIGLEDGTLKALGNVSALGTADGDILMWNNSTGKWEVSSSESLCGCYEKIVIWAEENSGLGNNQREWSFGNGATGLIGIPLPEDWEAYAVSFNADQSTNGAQVDIEVIDTATGSVLFPFDATGAANNMVFTEILDTPVNIPAGTSIGFRTDNVSGTVSDARVAVWLRRMQ